jgi:hypothetical protein
MPKHVIPETQLDSGAVHVVIPGYLDLFVEPSGQVALHMFDEHGDRVRANFDPMGRLVNLSVEDPVDD